MSMKVVVLGCGPAGLVAAHAACMFDQSNVDVRILSKPRKSFMRGAQYLHAPIPMMGEHAQFDIDYRLIGGTTADYATKVYGAGRVRAEDTSAAMLEGIHPAWDIRAAYDDLWATYGGYVTPWDASTQGLIEILTEWGADLVISSIPAPAICDNPEQHNFLQEQVWSTDEAFHDTESDYLENVVVCNASDSPAWYRSSMIHGWGNTEWPNDRKPPITSSKLWHVIKPVATNCDCFARIMRVGRYGTWTKGTLVHSIYEDVQREMGIVGSRLF